MSHGSGAAVDRGAAGGAGGARGARAAASAGGDARAGVRGAAVRVADGRGDRRMGPQLRLGAAAGLGVHPSQDAVRRDAVLAVPAAGAGETRSGAGGVGRAGAGRHARRRRGAGRDCGRRRDAAGQSQAGGTRGAPVVGGEPAAGADAGAGGRRDKTNEIPVAPTVLRGLLLEGRVVTMDALLTQREVAQAILDAGGDDVLVVTDNQPQLRPDSATLFSSPPSPASGGCAPRRARSRGTGGSSGGAWRPARRCEGTWTGPGRSRGSGSTAV